MRSFSRLLALQSFKKLRFYREKYTWTKRLSHAHWFFNFLSQIYKTVEAAVEAYGLKSLPGSDGEINVQESVEEMVKGYNDGSLTFTTLFNAVFDPEKKADAASATSSEESEEEKEEVESS